MQAHSDARLPKMQSLPVTRRMLAHSPACLLQQDVAHMQCTLPMSMHGPYMKTMRALSLQHCDIAYQPLALVLLCNHVHKKAVVRWSVLWDPHGPRLRAYSPRKRRTDA